MDRKMRSRLFVAVLLALAFLGGIVAASRTESTPPVLPEAKAIAAEGVSVTPQGRLLLEQFSRAFENAAAKVNASIVPIFAEQVVQVQNPFGYPGDLLRQFFGDNALRRFFGAPPQGRAETVRSLGSGVIVTTDGYILTNNHVVHGAQKLTVVLGSHKKYRAKVIGTDPQTDMAVIKIDARNLPAATLGNSDSVRVGEWVIAVGNPFQLMHTVTAGIISAKGRSSVGLADYEDFIQTDASINPGNSGGALANLDGKVIGINTAISSPSGGNVGIGFAIPINMAREVMDQLMATGKVTRGYLGVNIQDIDADLAKAMKLKGTNGALVAGVQKGGAADRAGIQRGDVIIELDGKKVRNSTELRNQVAQTKPGTAVKITLLRDGHQKRVTVTLAERPQNLASAAQTQGESQQQTSGRKLGLAVQTLTPDIAQQLGYQNDHGVVVTAVAPGSPAEDAGIQVGDLIKKVSHGNVNTIAGFNKLVARLKSGETAALLVRRGGTTFFLAIQIP